MRFKMDENLPIETAQLLREAGHDACTIRDQHMEGTTDPHVASVCRQEQRAIVSLDLDFSDIRTYAPRDYHGIIVLRPRTQSKPAVVELTKTLIPLLERESPAGNLWILQETGLRIREGT